MKSIKSALFLVALLGAVACGSAWAHGGHGGHGHFGHRAHVGVFFGAPLFWPYYPDPYYYPPVVVVPSSPPVYIEQGQLSPQQYWYFCSDPQGYYPYVKQCPAGWQQVTPQPAGN
jgi:hypothetical protein